MALKNNQLSTVGYRNCDETVEVPADAVCAVRAMWKARFEKSSPELLKILRKDKQVNEFLGNFAGLLLPFERITNGKKVCQLGDVVM